MGIKKVTFYTDLKHETHLRDEIILLEDIVKKLLKNMHFPLQQCKLKTKFLATTFSATEIRLHF
jgi:hypothetical protein